MHVFKFVKHNWGYSQLCNIRANYSLQFGGCLQHVCNMELLSSYCTQNETTLFCSFKNN